MEEDTGKRGKQKTHPVWNFLDFVRQGIKEAVYKCKLCGLEKEGISASRWTSHILGRAVGNATTAGIDSCSGGGEDKSKLKQAQQALNEYQRKADNKKDEKKKHDSALLDRVRLEREASAATAMQLLLQAKSQPTPVSANFSQSKLHFSPSTGKTVLQTPQASDSNKKPKIDDACRENHAVADAAVGRFFFETGLPFEPVEHTSFVNMADVLANHLDPKKGVYKPPTRYELTEHLLPAEVSFA